MPVETDLARVGAHDAGEALQEDRFAGAALAEHRDHAAARHGEIDPREHDIVAEAFVDAADVEEQVEVGSWGAHGLCTSREVMM